MIYTIFRLPHKGLRQNPTESDMPDLSDLSDYVGLCRIMSDFVGFCRILSDFVGFFVGFVGCDVGFCRKCRRPLFFNTFILPPNFLMIDMFGYRLSILGFSKLN